MVVVVGGIYGGILAWTLSRLRWSARRVGAAGGALLFLIAALYLMLDADFLAAVQVMLYVGGVTVLILFVVMLTYRIAATGRNLPAAGQANEQAGIAALVSAGLLAALAWMILQTPAWHDFIKPAPQAAAGGTTAAIGNMLLSEALLPFEVASLLLLAAMVGAIVLSRGREAR